jgi:hypothetical protein
MRHRNPGDKTSISSSAQVWDEQCPSIRFIKKTEHRMAVIAGTPMLLSARMRSDAAETVCYYIIASDAEIEHIADYGQTRPIRYRCAKNHGGSNVEKPGKRHGPAKTACQRPQE